jgi:hypothetical protein
MNILAKMIPVLAPTLEELNLGKNFCFNKVVAKELFSSLSCLIKLKKLEMKSFETEPSAMGWL